MAKARMDTRKQYFEDHPSRHEYTGCYDYVIERTARRVPLVIKRYEKCEHCPIERISFINVTQWRRVGGYYRGYKDAVIVRKSKASVLKEHVIKTTDLPDSDKKLLAEVKVTSA